MSDLRTFGGETPETSDVVLCDDCGELLHAPEEDVFWAREKSHEHKCVPMLERVNRPQAERIKYLEDNFMRDLIKQEVVAQIKHLARNDALREAAEKLRWRYNNGVQREDGTVEMEWACEDVLSLLQEGGDT